MLFRSGAAGIAGVFSGGAAALPAALVAGGLTALGWGASKAYHAMFATNKSVQTSGSSGSMSKEQWATSLLQKMNAPVTKENLSAILTWMEREGGGGTTTGIGTAGKKTAMYNPLNTTLGGVPGATKFNTVGVRNYTSWEQRSEEHTSELQSH